MLVLDRKTCPATSNQPLAGHTRSSTSHTGRGRQVNCPESHSLRPSGVCSDHEQSVIRCPRTLGTACLSRPSSASGKQGCHLALTLPPLLLTCSTSRSLQARLNTRVFPDFCFSCWLIVLESKQQWISRIRTFIYLPLRNLTSNPSSLPFQIYPLPCHHLIRHLRTILTTT